MSQASPIKIGLFLVLFHPCGKNRDFSSFDFTEDEVDEKLCIRFNKDTYTFSLNLMSPLVFS